MGRELSGVMEILCSLIEMSDYVFFKTHQTVHFRSLPFTVSNISVIKKINICIPFKLKIIIKEMCAFLWKGVLEI